MMKQPKEMYLLSLVEMCQRFAFWGIGSLLVLFLVQHHNFSDVEATHLYGTFSSVAFILPLLGGYIADRTSYKWAAAIGALFTSLGCFLLASGNETALYAALFFAAIGTSVFTPSIYTILSKIYSEKHHLREGGFSIYYSSVNIGVFLATFSLGALGQAGAWGWAFAIAGIIQLLGLVIFLKTMQNRIFSDMHAENRIRLSQDPAPKLKKAEKNRIAVILILSAVSILFWMAYNQGYSSMSLFSLRFTERQFSFMTIPPAWFSSLESLFLVILAFPLAWLYQFLAKRKLDPSPPAKTALSLVAMGLCFLVMFIGARQIAEGATSAAVSPWYLIIAYAFMALGEMLLAPIGLSLVTHLSPHRYTAFLVGAWYVCVGTAFYIGGLLAGMMSSMGDIADFFSIFVIASLVPAAILFFFVKKLDQMRHAKSL